MNQKIKELAEQAGLAYKMSNGKYWIDAGEVDIHLERFAELVRQDERNKKWTQKQWTDYELAIAADEREACAKLCESIDAEYEGEDVLATWCAKAIRARGNT
jgi:NDP-sugar pyrophosphorylase family protein